MPEPDSFKVLGLTGGIGSGKSTVRKFFEQNDVPCIDLDSISREMVSKGSTGLKQVIETFGSDYLTPQGELDRAKLKTTIFSDVHQKQALEAILHPLIRKETLDRIDQLANDSSLILVEIPLLAETGKPDYIHQVVACDCTENTQVNRVTRRDGLSESVVLNIMSQQASRKNRLALADHVINTDQPLAQIKSQVLNLITLYQ